MSAPDAQPPGHDVLIWSNPDGGHTQQGVLLPRGWVWCCACRATGGGYPTEAAADLGADAHHAIVAAALAGTTTPTNVLPPLTRLLMIAEELDSGAQLSAEQMADMADVLCEVHAALAASTPTEEG